MLEARFRSSHLQEGSVELQKPVLNDRLPIRDNVNTEDQKGSG